MPTDVVKICIKVVNSQVYVFLQNNYTLRDVANQPKA